MQLKKVTEWVVSFLQEIGSQEPDPNGLFVSNQGKDKKNCILSIKKSSLKTDHANLQFYIAGHEIDLNPEPRVQTLPFIGDFHVEC